MEEAAHTERPAPWRHAAAAILSQPYPGPNDSNRVEWHPVAYWSFKFDKAQRGYPIPDKEMLAIKPWSIGVIILREPPIAWRLMSVDRAYGR